MFAWIVPLITQPLGFGGLTLQAFGESISHGTATAYATRGISASGESQSLSFSAVFGRTTLIVGSGQSESEAAAAMSVINASLKVSPRFATIVDTSSFTGSGSIARRTV